MLGENSRIYLYILRRKMSPSMFFALYITEADGLLTSAFRDNCWIGNQTRGKSLIVLLA